ncbi:unnamed protein product [Closterium sp. Naga37s-1]|nr:unnamed protein product [Closterium sp. Naga37s-1]
MAEQIYNSDLTMSAAEEEALIASGEDLLVDDLPEGLIDHLADSAELPVAKKPCFDAGASLSPSSPSTNITASPESAQAHQARSPAPPELEAHRTAIFASINAMLCGFMFETGTVPPFEQTVGDPLRMARRVYGRLQFSWPSQADATAFHRLFPLSLKLPNSRPVLLKEFVDRFEEFTAAKAAGTPTISIRNVPMEYAPEDIRAFLLDSTEPDGAHWLADLTNFHRASDPYEGTYFTHLAGLPVATPDDPHFDLIPSEILPRPLPYSTRFCPLSPFPPLSPPIQCPAPFRPGLCPPMNSLHITNPPLPPPLPAVTSPTTHSFPPPTPPPPPMTLPPLPPLWSDLHSPTSSPHSRTPSPLPPPPAGNPPLRNSPSLLLANNPPFRTLYLPSPSFSPLRYFHPYSLSSPLPSTQPASPPFPQSYFSLPLQGSGCHPPPYLFWAALPSP